MPLVFLVLCHVFYMTATPEWLKRGLTWTVFLAALGEIGAPWLVRFVSAKFAILMALSGSFMGMGMLVLVAVPLYELWFRPRESNGKPANGPVPGASPPPPA
jgi:hypothetical protein